MPSISLTRREAEEGDLPNVCMRCAAPATVRKRYRFVSHPAWIYLLLPFGYLPYVIVAAVLTEHVRCYTQFCPRHKNHWRMRAFIIWGTFLVLLAVIGASFFLIVSLNAERAFGFCCVAWLVLMVCWLISIPIIQTTSIHPAYVTERRLTLKRVSASFVEAVGDYREKPRPGDLEDDRRKFRLGRAAPSEEMFDPERHRPSRPTSENIEEE
jgi:hypothetical protein